MDKVVSDRAKRYWDPHTGIGIPLDAVKLPAIRVHECGVMTLGPEWNIQRVCSPFWRAYANADAGAAVRLRGRRLDLLPGHLVILPEWTEYDCLTHAGTRHLWIHFSMDTARNPVEGAWDLKMPAALDAMIRDISKQARARKSIPDLLHHSCAAVLITAFAQLGGQAGARGTEKFITFRKWLNARLHTPPSLDAMAGQCGKSRRSFLRWFHAETGSTPAAFLMRQRIREACRLLRFGSESIEQIAESTGFANRHHFTRAFRAGTGTTPAAYRSR